VKSKPERSEGLRNGRLGSLLPNLQVKEIKSPIIFEPMGGYSGSDKTLPKVPIGEKNENFAYTC